MAVHFANPRTQKRNALALFSPKDTSPAPWSRSQPFRFYAVSFSAKPFLLYRIPFTFIIFSFLLGGFLGSISRFYFSLLIGALSDRVLFSLILTLHIDCIFLLLSTH